MLCPLLLCAALLLLPPLETPEGRSLPPSSAAQFAEQFLERYKDLLTLDDLENMLNSPPDEQPPSSGPGGQSGEQTPWLRLLRGSLAGQKRAEPDRLRRGWNRGCFGLKLDRIGSVSGLGC
ncbi:unnamed protein product [Knipowitschia caucasica]